MYHIEDRVSAIKSVQKMLLIPPTGIYDSKTRDTVIKIQRMYRLEESGVADYETFEAILAEYNKEKLRESDFSYLFAPKFPYTEGDIGDNIRLINEALELVLKDYRYDGPPPKGRYLGQDTVGAVKFLRGVFKMPLSEEIDRGFLNRLLLERDAIETKIKFS